MANSVDPDQTAPKGAVCSGSTLFSSIINSSVMLGNFLQQTTSAADIFRPFFLGVLRVNHRFPTILLDKDRTMSANLSKTLSINSSFTEQDGCKSNF